MQSNLLPAKASDQHAHNEGTHQAANCKDRHRERVHKGERLPTESCSITTQHCVVVEVLYILIGKEKVKK